MYDCFKQYVIRAQSAGFEGFFSSHGKAEWRVTGNGSYDERMLAHHPLGSIHWNSRDGGAISKFDNTIEEVNDTSLCTFMQERTIFFFSGVK